MKKTNKKMTEETKGTEAPQVLAAPPVLVWLRCEALQRDEGQIRKTFREESIAELAESLAGPAGMVSPMRAELVKASHKLLEPDLESSQWRVIELSSGRVIHENDNAILARGWCQDELPFFELEDFYKLIAGERRWRAALRLGSERTWPVLVGPVSEHERFAMQWAENSQWENVSLLEEADALAGKLAQRQAGDETFSPTMLAGELGIARATVYNRLNLRRCSGPVREALVAGKIDASVAQALAKIPLPEEQAKLLEEITDESDYRFPFSVREVDALIERDFVRQLKDAPFDQEETPELLEVNAAMTGSSCTKCPQRTGNMLEAFPKLAARPNVCTQPSCYTAKCMAHFQREAEKTGLVVVPESEFDARRQEFVSPVGTEYSACVPADWEDQSRLWKSLMGKKAPKPVAVVTEHGIEKLYRLEEATAAATKNGVTFEARRTPEPVSDGDRLAAQLEEKAREEKRRRMELYAVSRLPDLARGLAKMKDADAWEIIADAVARGHQFGKYNLNDEYSPGLYAAAKTPKAKVLGCLLADGNSEPVDYQGNWDKQIVALWKLCGVDLPGGFKEAEKSAQKELVLPKKKRVQGELAGMPAGGKKKAKG